MSQPNYAKQHLRIVNKVQITPDNRVLFIQRGIKSHSQKKIPKVLSPRAVPQTPTPSRKIINTVHWKSQSNETSQHSEIKQSSIFTLISSQEFQSKLKTEEKQDSQPKFNFDQLILNEQAGLLKKHKHRKKKIFDEKIQIQSEITGSALLGSDIFLKKVLQIIHTQYAQSDSASDTYFSDKFKPQRSSPRISFSNHLSTIPILNQQTQLKTLGTGFHQIMDTLMDQQIVQQEQLPIQQPKRLIHLTVRSPEEAESVLQFTVPDYCPPPVEETNQAQSPGLDKPSASVSQAVNQVSQASLTCQVREQKRNQSRFSQSILKIVGLRVEENNNKQGEQTFSSQKTRRFIKLYLQDKVQRILAKADDTQAIKVQFTPEYSHSWIHRQESPSTSRVLTSQTQNIGSPQDSMNCFTPRLQKQPQLARFLLPRSSLQVFTMPAINEDLQPEEIVQSAYDVDERMATSKIAVTFVDCCDVVKCVNHQHLSFVVSNLDDLSRNFLLSDPQIFSDQTFLQQTLSNLVNSLNINSINSRISRLQRADKIEIARQIFEKYNEILTGVFEDIHEISNMTQEYQFLEFEDDDTVLSPHLQCKTSLTVIPPIRITNKGYQAHGPQKPGETTPLSTDRTTLTTKLPVKIQASPRNAPLKQRDNKKKSSLLEAVAQTFSTVARKHTDSPSGSNQEESIKESNTTQSRQKTAANTQIVQGSNSKETQKHVVWRRDRRYEAGSQSMTKHSFHMRTYYHETERRSKEPLNQRIRLLIEEQKLNELIEAFANNPNIMINERCKDTNTYLIIAAQTGAKEIVELLLLKGAAVNMQNCDGDTALHRAIAFNFYQVADLLIQNGASIIKNNAGLTPWQLARK